MSPMRGTALHLAASTGSFRTCQVLLLNKAPLDVFDGQGQSPIDVAKTENIKKLIYKHL